MRDLRGLKICFIAGTLGQGGAERQLYYILQELVRHGARPRLLCLTQGEFWEQHIAALGVPATWVGQTGSRLARLRRIVAELRRDTPDVVQSQHFYTNLYAAVAARVLGIPGIGAVRSDVISEVAAGGKFGMGRLSLRAPRFVAANSRTGMYNAQAFGVAADRVAFLPNVVDTSRFAGRLMPKPDRVRILTIGRLVPAKRFDRFLRVVADVRHRAHVPLSATIVGDGPLRSELESLAATLGLGPDVLTFAGAADSTVHHYQQADVFVLTSDWEGTPNVVLEAMSSGLPIVATRVGGLEDLVPEGAAGALLDSWDEEGLAEAVLALVDAEVTRRAWGRAARTYVERHHAVAALAGHLRALYATLPGSPPAMAAG